MADIVKSTSAGENFNITLAAGEYVSIKILNSDKSVKEVLAEKQCPSGQTFAGSCRYDGNLT